MFGTLLESRPQRRRPWGGTTMSVVAHTALIAIAVRATVRAAVPPDQAPEATRYVDVKDDVPPPPPAPDLPPRHLPDMGPVITIPTTLPDIDPTMPVTNEADFRGLMAAPPAQPHGVAPSPTDGVYLEMMVEKPVTEAPDTQHPRYPDILRSGGIEGMVVTQFVVDTTGRIESGSFKVLSSTNALFTAAVRSAMPTLRYVPAEVGGRRVRQLVQQPFVFALRR